MLKFKGGEWFHISGRGWVYATRTPQECDNFSHIMSHEVEIEGHMYTVSGVEFMGFTSYKEGGPLGLLVVGPVKGR